MKMICLVRKAIKVEEVPNLEILIFLRWHFENSMCLCDPVFPWKKIDSMLSLSCVENLPVVQSDVVPSHHLNICKALHVETSPNKSYWQPFSTVCKLCAMKRLNLCIDRAFDLSVGLKWSKQATHMLRT